VLEEMSGKKYGKNRHHISAQQCQHDRIFRRFSDNLSPLWSLNTGELSGISETGIKSGRRLTAG
jgi:hypothetical protein